MRLNSFLTALFLTALFLTALGLLSACATDDGLLVIPPPATEADYQCASEGDLSCVRKLKPGVQDCIIDHVAEQIAVCTRRCDAELDGVVDCGAECNNGEKNYIASGVARCRPPAPTIPPP